MAITAYLIPVRKDALPRDPRTRARLPEVGALKPMTGPAGRYWRRRLKDGSVVVGTPPVRKAEKRRKEKEE